jgi:hypothetical protein
MRYRLMAAYRGAPYEAGVGPTEGDVVLFAACPPPEELGFEPATGHWRKQLRIGEVQALWESRPVGTFRGERCMVLDDLGDRLHIAYLGHDGYQAEQLGYWQVDRGVFELVTPREEVSDIVEERLDYPAHSASSAHSAHSAQPGAVTTHPGPARPAVPGPGAAAVPRPGGSAAPGDPGAMPPAGEPLLPLELAARRAASARVLQPAGAAMPQQAPSVPQPAPTVTQPAMGAAPPAPTVTPPAPPTAQPAPPTAQSAPPVRQSARATAVAQGTAVPAPARPAESAPARQAKPARGGRRSALRRQATQQIFSELASLAAIPPSAYALGEEIDGAMCLIQTADGFEVFNAAAGARHEVRIFDDEESAYFYLFGVLAAEAVRTGRLAPQG